MPIIFGTTASGGDNFFTPQPPTIGTSTDVGTSRAYNNGAATVTFTPSTSGGTATSFTATSTPGSFTGSAASSPVTVAGLQSATSYTFAVTATDAQGTSSASSASNSITATTVPQAPTIGTVTDGGTGTTVSIPFTAGATGGKTISSYSIISSPATTTQTTSSSPYTFTGLTAGTAYTFQVTATNANGTSSYSAASNAVTPVVPTSFYNIATQTLGSTTSSVTFSSLPSGYTSFQIRSMAQFSGTGNANTAITFNGDSSASYGYHRLVGGGGTTYANGTASDTAIYYVVIAGGNGNYNSSTFNVSVVDIIDPLSTTKNKVLRAISGGDSNNTTYDQINLSSGVWLNTSAITSITLNSNGFSYLAGSTFALYGVK